VVTSVGLLLACFAGTNSADGQLFQKLFGGGVKEQQQQQQQPRNGAQNPARPATPQQQPRQAQRTGAPQQRQAATPSPLPVTPPKPQPLVPIEEATPEERAAFGQLIGANWIWSPAHDKDAVPSGQVFFRKTLTLGQVEFGQVHISADNQYELFVNGQSVATGNDWRKMDVHNVAKLLRPGQNVIAVRVTNIDEGPAGLVARVLTKEPAGTFESHSTDDTWRLPAADLGALGSALPWGDEVVIAEEGARFVVDPEFTIERITTDEQTGSLVAMTFDADGNILASQEGGPLLLVKDADGDGKFESVGVFSDQINTAQGILSLGRNVFAVADGPDGGALYRLADANRDGQADDVKALLPFRGSAGEHGPHAVRLGPDGLLYVIVGNFARVGARPNPESPYAIEYEGDLVQPRYEDPRGHAVGVPAPGGTVIRTDANGSFVEVVAGGLRNAYDFAFNNDGELFTFDADMEWDLGTPWYRPTRINHVTPGAELGWRSGWAKWPSHYVDSLPELLALGGGSPTGVEYYNHHKFPVRLHNTLFVGDWARGLIHAVKLEPEGGSYKATSAVFLKGRPLNVTDLAVGPDGALYFSTGGRGTDGGIYRVSWKGKVPPEISDLGNGILPALRQPQLDTAWARAKVEAVKDRFADRWGPQLQSVARDGRFSATERTRALQLLNYYGPAPSAALLLELSADRDPAVRTQTARMMGMQNDAQFGERLTALLSDADGRVRRTACEAIAHRRQEAPVDALVALLADEDRFVAFAARRALETLPAQQWYQPVLLAEQPRVFLQGATGLLIAQPSPQLSQMVLDRAEDLLPSRLERRAPLAADAHRDLLRVIELALLRGQIDPQQVAGVTTKLVDSYPTGDAETDRELVKLLAYLDPPEAAAKFASQLASDIPEIEKLQVAAYAPRLKSGWTTPDKLAFLRYYETIRDIEGGYSVSAYVENFARDFFTNLSIAERRQVLAAGEHYPTSALSVLAKLPKDAGPDVLAEVRALDGRIAALEGDAYDRLRVGVVATLGGTDDAESLAYLHELYQTTPKRRAPIAMSLTQNPTGENWDLLVDSLGSIDGVASGDVLYVLAQVQRRPQDAEPFRNAILQGLRMGDDGGNLAVAVLENWSGTKASRDDAPIVEQLASWQAWYAQQFPAAPPAELPRDTGKSKWSFEELLSFLDTDEGRAGDSTRGAAVFNDAQCISCHRINGGGERLGPDLTNLGSRFQTKEVLESIIYPSHDISDQYASRAVTANGRTYVGIAVREGEESVVVLTATGEKVRLAYADVEAVEASPLSAMPEGLLNKLTLSQVSDLFAYLMDRPAANVAGRATDAGR
jgi:putative membrane-bound dehydrogenase-like protein